MTILKFIAQNKICGLLPPKRAADGRIIHHELKTGDVIELEVRKASFFVQGGSLKPKNEVAYREAGGLPYDPQAQNRAPPTPGEEIR